MPQGGERTVYSKEWGSKESVRPVQLTRYKDYWGASRTEADPEWVDVTPFSYQCLRMYEELKQNGRRLWHIRLDFQPFAPKFERDKGLLLLAAWVPGSREHEERDVMVRLASNEWIYAGHYEFGLMEVFKFQDWALQTNEVCIVSVITVNMCVLSRKSR